MTDTNVTIISKICMAMNEQRKADRLLAIQQQDRLHAIQQQAAHAFAELNGWRTGPKVKPFEPQDLHHEVHQRRNAVWRRREFWENGVLDHPLYFRDIHGPAAIVTQPYSHIGPQSAQHDAAHYGLRLHVPPQPLMSFHYPGSCAFYVFTKPDHYTVQWLPEQIAGLNDVEAVRS